MDDLSLNLTGIDRNRRRRHYLTKILFLIPLGTFFFLCFYTGRDGADYTLPERYFNFSSYWRTIGIVGLLATFILYFALHKLLPYKVGSMIFSKESLEMKFPQRQIFQIKSMDQIVIHKDLPYQDDDEMPSKMASRICFEYLNDKYDYEMEIATKAETETLTQIINLWKESKQDILVKYIP